MYDPDEVAAILGFEDRVVQRCVDEFLFTARARGRHERSSELRWEKPDAERVTSPEEPEPSPEEILAARERRSAETARWLGIDEAPARAFFEEGLLPSVWCRVSAALRRLWFRLRCGCVSS